MTAGLSMLRPTCPPESPHCFVVPEGRLCVPARNHELWGQRELGSCKLTRPQSFKDSICLEQQRPWNGKTENPCCPEVDRQLELRRLLDGQFARLRALHDPINVHRGPPEQLGVVREIRNEAAGFEPGRSGLMLGSLLLLCENLSAVFVDDIAARRVVDSADMLSAKQYLPSKTECEPLRDSRIVFEHADVAVANSSPHDHPHPVDTSVDNATSLTGLDVEQQLYGVARR